ncbi:hypothetical protein FD729_01520 [Pantoea sp. Nvir]|uniref:hypothetical protein n=1 Tax=Pantoea sp. Nvir TaxID=2576760 RepID=UPI001358DC4F|nr:hypothetical protein [Pantoea sp. Nvir]MXP66453.1 hypothetical protein [Pantoea sp. Nvir]
MTGDYNDYFGKGMSSSTLSIRPLSGSTSFSYKPPLHVIPIFTARQAIYLRKRLQVIRGTSLNLGIIIVMKGTENNYYEYMVGGISSEH